MKTYITHEGEMVDEICKKLFDDEKVEAQIYSLNPGLAAYGPLLPSGIIIKLPEHPSETPVQVVRLWD